MGLFNFFQQPNFNQLYELFTMTSNAVLLDVRTEEEYAEGHVPNSKNLPVEKIEKIKTVVPNKETPLFVYCLSGARSRTACQYLEKQGYTDIHDLGGIHNYTGNIEK